MGILLDLVRRRFRRRQRGPLPDQDPGAEHDRPERRGRTRSQPHASAERLRAAGVALRVSFGRARGEELAARCRDTSRLQGEYASVLDRYHALAADFDLEGAAFADRSAMARRAEALFRLQAQPGRRLTVSLTLPVSPDGLSAPALDAVRAVVGAGVHLGAVHLLAMDYGLAAARGHMLAEAVLARRGTPQARGARGRACWLEVDRGDCDGWRQRRERGDLHPHRRAGRVLASPTATAWG